MQEVIASCLNADPYRRHLFFLQELLRRAWEDVADKRTEHMDWAAGLRLRAAGWYIYQVAIKSACPDELRILKEFIRPANPVAEPWQCQVKKWACASD